ncbi:MAG: prolipoprotein diacylglyceryl transferase [Gemmatimonadota bacterium]
MYPDLIEIGNFTISSFGAMLFVAFVVAAWVAGIQMERRGYEGELMWEMVPWLAIGGIVGAKLYYVGLHWQDLVADPAGALFSRGGLVWYGGFIGGVAAFVWQVRRRGLPLAPMFDSVAPSLALAYAIGRIGCFLVGDDYGLPTESWVGIAFPDGTPPSTAGNLRAIGVDIPASVADWEVLAVHPTQLYEVGAALIMFAVLWRISRRALAAGQLFGLYLALYGIERFLIEFVRAKGDRYVFGLTTSQVASMLVLALGAYLWYRRTEGGKPAAEPGRAAARPAESAAASGRPSE